MAGTQYYFRDFRLDPAARELWQGDRAVVLPASALDGLIYLIENRDRAVGRDELIAAIWGRVDVADTLLAQTVLRIRRQLGDTGAEQSAIRTVPRFGYRWVEETRCDSAPPPVAEVAPAPVTAPTEAKDTRETPDEAVALPPAPEHPAAPAVSASTRRVVLVGLGLVVLVILALSVWRLPRNGAEPATEAGAVAAYVLPATVPDMAEWSWLRLGLMDLVANRLRQGGLSTAPSESVLASLRQAETTSAALPKGLAVQPQAIFHDGRWTVSLKAVLERDSVTAQASASDVLAAARMAVDELLIRLGRTPPVALDGSDDLALQELLQRTRAAILADQFDLARNLIAQAPETLRARAEVGLRLVQIDMGQGDYDAAKTALERLLDGSSGRPLAADLHGRILNTLGGVQMRRGDLAGAAVSYAEAVDLLRNGADLVGLGQGYAGLGAVAANQGRLDAAEGDLGRARVAMEAGGDPLAVAQVDLSLGLLATKRYRPAEALPVMRDAATRLAAIGAQEEWAYTQYAIVETQLQLLDFAGARATSDATWPPERHTGNARIAWELTQVRAQMLIGEGRLDEADRLLARIAEQSDPVLDKGVRLTARVLAATSALERGSDARAVSLAEAAWTPELEREEPGYYLDAWRVYLKALRGIGRLADARSGTAALREWVERNGDDRLRTLALLSTAEQAWADGARDEALAGFSAAAGRADRLGMPDLRVEAGVALLRALLAIDRSERASEVAGALAPWAQSDFRVASATAEVFHALGREDAWRRAAERTRELAGQRALPASLSAPEPSKDEAGSLRPFMKNPLNQ